MDSKDKIVNFKDLKIWQRGTEFVKVVYQRTNSFPSVMTLKNAIK